MNAHDTKTKMTSQQKQSSPYLAYIISVLSIALCFAVFLRTEFELMEHRKRIEALEDSKAAVKTKALPTLEPTLSTITKHIAGEYLVANSARKSCDAKPSRHYFIIIWKRQN